MINDLGMGIVVTMRDLFSRNAAKIESSMESLDAKVVASGGDAARGRSGQGGRGGHWVLGHEG